MPTLINKSKTMESQAHQHKQQLIATCSSSSSGQSSQETFNRDICDVFIGCNIPLGALEMLCFKSFFESIVEQKLTI